MSRKGKTRSKNNPVIVRYPTRERNSTIVIFVLCFLIAIALGLWSGEILIYLAMIGLIVLPSGLMMAYHLSWKIVITASEISKHSFFHRPKVYRYSDIVKAIETSNTYERDIVFWLQFQDGKWITLRSRYENYCRAVNKVLKQKKILSRDGADEKIISKGTELYIEGQGDGSLYNP